MVTDLYRTVKSVAQPINGDSLTFDPQHNQFFFFPPKQRTLSMLAIIKNARLTHWLHFLGQVHHIHSM